MAAKDEASAEYAEANQQLEVVNQQLRIDIEAAEARHREATIPIQKMREAAIKRIQEAEEARRQLVDGAPDELKRRRRENELAQNRNRNDTYRKCRELREAIEQIHVGLKQATGDEKMRLEFRLGNTERELSHLESQERSLIAEGNRLYQAMLDA
jgi:hypothetical protein